MARLSSIAHLVWDEKYRLKAADGAPRRIASNQLKTLVPTRGFEPRTY